MLPIFEGYGGDDDFVFVVEIDDVVVKLDLIYCRCVVVVHGDPFVVLVVFLAGCPCCCCCLCCC